MSKLEEIRANVVSATVQLTRLSGQGVLVPGNIIVTAAHCIGWTSEMALGDYYIEEIRAGGRDLKVSPLAVEPVHDIALLGSVDSQEFYKDSGDFEDFCESTKPVPLCTSEFKLFQPFPMHILTHHGYWISGEAQQTWERAPNLWLSAPKPLDGGTSGGPVIDEQGRLLGIISHTGSTDPKGPWNATTPRPHLAAPVWLARRMCGELED